MCSRLQLQPSDTGKCSPFPYLYLISLIVRNMALIILHILASFFFKVFIYLFIYFWLCWVFVSVRGLSLVAASGGHSSSRCAGLSVSRPLLLRSTGSRRASSVVVAHGPSCSAACGIFPDQGSNPCPLHWQADSQPLHHQGSPLLTSLSVVCDQSHLTPTFFWSWSPLGYSLFCHLPCLAPDSWDGRQEVPLREFC